MVCVVATVLIIAFFPAFVLAAPAADRISNLPGFSAPTINFEQYAGLVTVDESHGRNLYYWFVTSQRSPRDDPVVLWLNGGPGCSSLGGLLSEHGPFYPLDDGKTLVPNPYSWNQFANVIYLESPSGVGFSYSSNESDYTTGDRQTTADSMVFLVKFFTSMFPEFASNDFWVTGESYGGHYVPLLVSEIMDHNAANPGSVVINLKGLMVGNPWTSPVHDNYGAVLFWASRYIISPEAYLSINTTCNYAETLPFILYFRNMTTPDTVSVECYQSLRKAQSEMGPINYYDIFVDVCDSNATAEKTKGYLYNGVPFSTKSGWSPVKQDPCMDSYVQTYLNSPDVKNAIHASQSPNKWVQCTDKVNYSMADVSTSMLPVYQDLLPRQNLRILVYSGDMDAVVPHIGTQKWISKLLLHEVQGFQPWIDSTGQVGGYVIHFEKEFTYATVRGAGHMVPAFQPMRGLDMFSRFLKGTF